MSSITVRRMSLDVPDPDHFDPRWVAGNIVVSYVATGVSLYVAHLEPFLVKSLRRVMERITDAGIRADVDRFCRQEAQHYQQHERFNSLIFARNYPGLEARSAVLKADFEGFLAQQDERWCVGFVEGFEAYTTQSALKTFQSRMLEHPRTNPEFGALFRWHMAEELEHRLVAYDVYQHLYGDYGFRVKLCWIAQTHIWRFILDCMKLMSPVDAAEFGPEYRVSALARGLSTAVVAPMFFRTYLPGYSPHKLRVPAAVAELCDELSAVAESTS